MPDPDEPLVRPRLLPARACRSGLALLAAAALLAALVPTLPVRVGVLLIAGGAVQVDWAQARWSWVGSRILVACGALDVVAGALLELRLGLRPALPGLILASFLIGGGLLRLNGAAVLRFAGWPRQAVLGGVGVLAGVASLLDWPGGPERPIAAAIAALLAGLAWSAAPPGGAAQRTST